MPPPGGAFVVRLRTRAGKTRMRVIAGQVPDGDVEVYGDLGGHPSVEVTWRDRDGSLVISAHDHRHDAHR